MSVLTKSSTVFNSVNSLNTDEYYVFEISPLATVSAKGATKENLIATDFSGNTISFDEIIYSPNTNTIQAITKQDIPFLDNFECKLTLCEESFDIVPTISKNIDAEGIGLINYGFYDRNGNIVYNISERIDLIFKATLMNSSDEDIIERTFRFSKNSTTEIIDEQTLSIPKGTGIEIEVVCDFELTNGDRITLY